MTGTRRLSILAIVPILVAACATAPPVTPSPSTSAIGPTEIPTVGPTSAPSAVATPVGLPTPALTPDSACRAVGAEITPDYDPPSAGASIRFAAVPASMGLWVVSATALHDPTLTWTAEPGEPPLDEVGMLPGGHELRFRFGVGYGFDADWPITINAIAVTLRRDNGSERELRTRLPTVDGEQVIRIRIPDITARGWLAARIEWTDRCLAYVALGFARIRIVPGDVVDACPTDMHGINAHIEALHQPPLGVGGVPVRVYTSTIIGLWDEFYIAADGPAFGLWDQTLPPAAGESGGSILVAEANPDLVLNELGAFFFRRRDVLDWLEGTDTSIDPVFRVTVEPSPDGSFGLALPNDPRRYVALLHFEWDSPCLKGQSRAVVAIDVG